LVFLPPGFFHERYSVLSVPTPFVCSFSRIVVGPNLFGSSLRFLTPNARPRLALFLVLPVVLK